MMVMETKHMQLVGPAGFCASEEDREITKKSTNS